MFIAIKTEDGMIKGKISFYCKMLDVSRQAFHNHLKTKGRPWKYQPLADAMLDICQEDECNDTYGRIRMYIRHILCFVVQFFTVTEVHNIQVSYTVKQSINMAFSRA